MLNDFIIKKDKLIQKKMLLEEKLKLINDEIFSTEKVINKLCQHSWVTDYIDNSYGDGSYKIKYCEHCYLTK
mgnify:CR=1 FL=1